MFGLVPFKADLARNDDIFAHLMNSFDEPFFRNFDSASFKVDVKETAQDYELTAELPGLTKDDISLDYADGYLTISANKTQENKEDDGKGYLRRERSFGSMSRSFYIDNIDKTKTTAGFKDGVLTVRLPKLSETEQPRHKIQIMDGKA